MTEIESDNKKLFAHEVRGRLQGLALANARIAADDPLRSQHNANWAIRLHFTGFVAGETNLKIPSNVFDYSGTDDPAIDEDCRRIREILRGYLRQGKLPKEILYQGRFN